MIKYTVEEINEQLEKFESGYSVTTESGSLLVLHGAEEAITNVVLRYIERELKVTLLNVRIRRIDNTERLEANFSIAYESRVQA